MHTGVISSCRLSCPFWASRSLVEYLYAHNRRAIGVETLLATHETRFNAIHPILQSTRDLKAKMLSMEQALASRMVTPTPSLTGSQDPWLQNFGTVPDGSLSGLNVAHPPTLIMPVNSCEHTAHSALRGTLQGVSRRSPGRSRPQELGRYGRTRRPEG
jgi:hypothetical protein